MFSFKAVTLADKGAAGLPAARRPSAAAAPYSLRPPPGLEALTPVQQLPASSHEDLRARWRASKTRAEVTEMLLTLQARGVVRAPFSDKLSAQSTMSAGRDSEADSRSDLDSSTSEECAPKDAGGPTTLMIRNIPADCTCDELLEEWPVDGSYDLLYLPRRAGGRATLGYAFMNFTSPAHAEAFASAWKARRFARYPKGRGLNITVADKQGFESNAQQLKQKNPQEMRSRQCEVVVVKGGRRVTLQDV